MAKGYTKIENDIFDFILSSDIKDAELKILLFLIRYTKGFQRDTVRAAYSYIAKGTGYGEWTVRKCIKKLENRKLLEVTHKASGSAPQLVKLNYCNFTTRGSATTPPQVVAEHYDKVVVEHYQDIKEDIKDRHKRIEREIDKKPREKTWEELKQEDFDD